MSDAGEIENDGFMRLQLQDGQLSFSRVSTNGTEQTLAASLESISKTLARGALNEATVENVIYQVEELIMPILRRLPSCTELKVDGSRFSALMPLLDTKHGLDVTLETVEDLYRRFADHAAGSPIAWKYPISAEEIALALLVLRETMHHGGFESFGFS